MNESASCVDSAQFDALVVLYEKRIVTISSLRTLTHSDRVRHIIICDNSVDSHRGEYLSLPSAEQQKIVYRWMGGNKGLPAAYSTGIELSTAPYICVLDDDTTLPPNYFELVSSYMRSEEAVYLPLVYSRQILLSPCARHKYRIKAFRSEADIHGRLSAINSGMVIARQVFDCCSYDSRLFLDMVDHSFMDKVHQNHILVVVMHDAVLQQNYSRESYDKEAEIERYKILKGDNRTFWSTTLIGKALCAAQLLLRRVRMANKYHDMRLLRL